MSDEWLPQPPHAIVPQPAAGRSDLRGRRVLVGAPGIGWRADLRADHAVVQASRTYVPVLPEPDWYRAEAEQIETFAALVPVERVWVEALDKTEAGPSDRPTDLFARLVSLDAPARRQPVSARDASLISGRRIIQVGTEGEHRDLRAVTEPYQNADSDICVRICRELDWYRWGWTGQHPRTREVAIYLLWVE